MNKFSMKKKGKEVPTEAVIAYSKDFRKAPRQCDRSLHKELPL